MIYGEEESTITKTHPPLPSLINHISDGVVLEISKNKVPELQVLNSVFQEGKS